VARFRRDRQGGKNQKSWGKGQREKTKKGHRRKNDTCSRLQGSNVGLRKKGQRESRKRPAMAAQAGMPMAWHQVKKKGKKQPLASKKSLRSENSRKWEEKKHGARTKTLALARMPEKNNKRERAGPENGSGEKAGGFAKKTAQRTPENRGAETSFKNYGRRMRLKKSRKKMCQARRARKKQKRHTPNIFRGNQPKKSQDRKGRIREEGVVGGHKKPKSW